MTTAATVEQQAEVAFSRYIDARYAVRMCKPVDTQNGQQIVDWTVEYSNGDQISGVCFITENHGYSVCISGRYDQVAGRWSHPHTWHHGFLDS